VRLTNARRFSVRLKSKARQRPAAFCSYIYTTQRTCGYCLLKTCFLFGGGGSNCRFRGCEARRFRFLSITASEEVPRAAIHADTLTQHTTPAAACMHELAAEASSLRSLQLARREARREAACSKLAAEASSSMHAAAFAIHTYTCS
jgi:hypothetical protein